MQVYGQGNSYSDVCRILNARHGTKVAKRTVLLWARSAGVGRGPSEGMRASSRFMDRVRAWGRSNAIPLRRGFGTATEGLGYIVGVSMGDGYLGKYEIRLQTVDREFAQAFGDAVGRQFGRVPSLRDKPGGPWISPINGKTYIRDSTTNALLVSKPAADFLRSVMNEDWVRGLPRKGKLGWLRGIWDSEGSITRDRKGPYWRVLFSVGDERIARTYVDVLRELTGIDIPLHYEAGRRQWHCSFGRIESVVKFFRIVEPTIGRKRSHFARAERHYRRRLEALGGRLTPSC